MKTRFHFDLIVTRAFGGGNASFFGEIMNDLKSIQNLRKKLISTQTEYLFSLSRETKGNLDVCINENAPLGFEEPAKFIELLNCQIDALEQMEEFLKKEAENDLPV
jgi:hypothetical protein